ncbi:MAG TPA: 2OG-Fe(II) oxygenase family protein [Leptolyngbyaceae cyanobacterium]
MSGNLVEIPIIEFDRFSKGNTESQNIVADQIYDACHKIGFMYLKSNKISSTLIAQVFGQSQLFFNLPLPIKNRLSWSDEFSNRGYVAVEREKLNIHRPGDLKEAFNIGKEVDRNQLTTQKEQANLILNQWPTELTGFRETMLEFYQACSEFVQTLCQAFALALKLPDNFFTSNHNQQEHTLRLLHYPPLKESSKPGQIRAGEHSDYGSFTLLFQDEVGGLEVCTVNEEWVAAPSIPGTIVVNTGDLMQRWTNHVFCSTKHRVIIPNDDRINLSRYSIAFFCHPNNDTQISCIESCQDINHPPLYSPISAGDYLISRLQASY